MLLIAAPLSELILGGKVLLVPMEDDTSAGSRVVLLVGLIALGLEDCGRCCCCWLCIVGVVVVFGFGYFRTSTLSRRSFEERDDWLPRLLLWFFKDADAIVSVLASLSKKEFTSQEVRRFSGWRSML